MTPPNFMNPNKIFSPEVAHFGVSEGINNAVSENSHQQNQK